MSIERVGVLRKEGKLEDSEIIKVKIKFIFVDLKIIFRVCLRFCFWYVVLFFGFILKLCFKGSNIVIVNEVDYCLVI